MPTQRQMKSIALHAALLNGKENIMGSMPLDARQVGMDMGNFALTEYMTREKVLEMTGNMMQGVSPEMKRLVVDTALGIAQDMVIQRFVGGRQRSLTDSVIGFTLSNYAGDQLTSRVSLFQ